MPHVPYFGIWVGEVLLANLHPILIMYLPQKTSSNIKLLIT